MTFLFRLIIFLISGILFSCTTSEAPVVDGWKQQSAQTSGYKVQLGDTIYSIAWAFNMDYRDLAQSNHLHEPYSLAQVQTLSISPRNTHTRAEPTPTFATTHPVSSPPRVTTSNIATIATSTHTTHLRWPTQGKVNQGFSNASGGNKGIDIVGTLGQPILATATGKVVYTGASLPGYGNLIIIKHDDNRLSAYAFNQVIAVKEGQVVKVGQQISKMGVNEAGKPMLHFEIREGGKPVDPMKYLG